MPGSSVPWDGDDWLHARSDPAAADAELALAVGRKLFLSALDPMMLTTPGDGAILDANPVACRVLGYSVEEIRALGREGLRDHNDPQWEQGLRTREETGSYVGEIRMRRADGTSFPAEVTSSTFLVRETRYAVLIFRDVSERHRIVRRAHSLLMEGSSLRLTATADDAEETP